MIALSHLKSKVASNSVLSFVSGASSRVNHKSLIQQGMINCSHLNVDCILREFSKVRDMV